VCHLSAVLIASITDRRPEPRISTATVAEAAMVLFWARMGSLNALEMSGASRFWKRWLGHPMPSAETMGDVHSKMDAGTLREAIHQVYGRLKSNKALPDNGGISLAIVDGQPSGLVAFHHRRRDLHNQLLAEVVCYVPEGVDRERGRFVLGLVFDKELVCRLLDRLPPLFAGFLFDDLAVALLQPLALAALLLNRLWLVGSAGGATVPTPVQEEFVVVEPAAFENSHAGDFCLDPMEVQRCVTVKSKLYAVGQVRAACDQQASQRHCRRPVAIPETPQYLRTCNEPSFR
jgi:hypothetical protein